MANPIKWVGLCLIALGLSGCSELVTNTVTGAIGGAVRTFIPEPPKPVKKKKGKKAKAPKPSASDRLITKD